jgi:hypothetical protein
MVRRESSIALGSRWHGVIGGSIAHPTFSLLLELENMCTYTVE